MADAVCNWWTNLVKKLVNYKGDWLRENRGSLMTVAALIVTITFQPAIAPPGGVWQNTTYPKYDDSWNLTSVPPNTSTDDLCYPDATCYAGTAVFAYSNFRIFSLFIVFDTISFLASLAVLFLLIIGFPRENNKVSMWILTITVCISLSSLGFTFVLGMMSILPFDQYKKGPLSLGKVVVATVFSWLGLCAIGTLTIVVLSLHQIIKYCVKRFSGGGGEDDRKITHTHHQEEEEEEELQPYSTEEP